MHELVLPKVNAHRLQAQADFSGGISGVSAACHFIRFEHDRLTDHSLRLWADIKVIREELQCPTIVPD